MRAINQLKCSKCGKFFINLVDHSSCPDWLETGHGKLHPLMTDSELCLTVMDAIPVARKVVGRKNGRYLLNGSFVRVRRQLTWTAAAKSHLKGKLVAKCDGIKCGFGEFEIVEKK